MPTVSVSPHNGDSSLTPTHEAEVQVAENLLEQLNKGQQNISNCCNNGACGVCRIEITAGAELLSPPCERENETLKRLEESYIIRFGENYLSDKELRLTCQARVSKDGDITFTHES